jgi:hypothetical protein
MRSLNLLVIVSVVFALAFAFVAATPVAYAQSGNPFVDDTNRKPDTAKPPAGTPGATPDDNAKPGGAAAGSPDTTDDPNAFGKTKGNADDVRRQFLDDQLRMKRQAQDEAIQLEKAKLTAPWRFQGVKFDLFATRVDIDDNRGIGTDSLTHARLWMSGFNLLPRGKTVDLRIVWRAEVSLYQGTEQGTVWSPVENFLLFNAWDLRSVDDDDPDQLTVFGFDRLYIAGQIAEKTRISGGRQQMKWGYSQFRQGSLEVFDAADPTDFMRGEEGYGSDLLVINQQMESDVRLDLVREFFKDNNRQDGARIVIGNTGDNANPTDFDLMFTYAKFTVKVSGSEFTRKLVGVAFRKPMFKRGKFYAEYGKFTFGSPSGSSDVTALTAGLEYKFPHDVTLRAEITNWSEEESPYVRFGISRAFAESDPSSLTLLPDSYMIVSIEWTPSETFSIRATAWRESEEDSMVMLARLTWRATDTLSVRAGVRTRSGDEPSYFGGDQDDYSFLLADYRFYDE